jgi:hypothetical protein
MTAPTVIAASTVMPTWNAYLDRSRGNSISISVRLLAEDFAVARFERHVRFALRFDSAGFLTQAGPDRTHRHTDRAAPATSP